MIDIETWAKWTGESSTPREGQTLSDAHLSLLVAALVDEGYLTLDNLIAAMRVEPDAFPVNATAPSFIESATAAWGALRGQQALQTVSKAELRQLFTNWLKAKEAGALAALVTVAGVSGSNINLVAGQLGLADLIRPSGETETGSAMGERVPNAQVSMVLDDGTVFTFGAGDVRGLGRLDATPVVTLTDVQAGAFEAMGLVQGQDYQVQLVIDRGEGGQQTQLITAQLIWQNPSDEEMRIALFRSGQFSAEDLGATGTEVDADTGQNTLVFGDGTGAVAPVVAEVAGLQDGGADFDSLLGTAAGADATAGASSSRRWLPLPDVYSSYQAAPPLLGMPSGMGGVYVDRDGTSIAVSAYWEEGDAALFFSTWSAETLAGLQLRMEKAHILRAGSYRLGVWDQASQAAMEAVMAYANTRGIDPSDPRLAQQAAMPLAPGVNSTGQIGAAGLSLQSDQAARIGSLLLAMDLLGQELPLVPDYQPATKTIPDAAYMAQVVRNEFTSRAGRGPSDQEMRYYIDRMSRDYNQSLDRAQLQAEQQWIQDMVDQGYVPTANQSALLAQQGGTQQDIDPVSRFREVFEQQESRLMQMGAERVQRGKLKDSLIGSALTGRTM